VLGRCSWPSECGGHRVPNRFGAGRVIHDGVERLTVTRVTRSLRGGSRQKRQVGHLLTPLALVAAFATGCSGTTSTGAPDRAPRGTVTGVASPCVGFARGDSVPVHVLLLRNSQVVESQTVTGSDHFRLLARPGQYERRQISISGHGPSMSSSAQVAQPMSTFPFPASRPGSPFHSPSVAAAPITMATTPWCSRQSPGGLLMVCGCLLMERGKLDQSTQAEEIRGHRIEE
jgi:hypothetical protein